MDSTLTHLTKFENSLLVLMRQCSAEMFCVVSTPYILMAFFVSLTLSSGRNWILSEYFNSGLGSRLSQPSIFLMMGLMKLNTSTSELSLSRSSKKYAISLASLIFFCSLSFSSITCCIFSSRNWRICSKRLLLCSSMDLM